MVLSRPILTCQFLNGTNLANGEDHPLEPAAAEACGDEVFVITSTPLMCKTVPLLYAKPYLILMENCA